MGYKASRDALTQFLERLPPRSRLTFDPSPLISAIPEPALNATLRISANADEAATLTGKASPATAATALADTRPDTGGAMVRDGANGCFIAEKGQISQHVPGHHVIPVDTNGAGDTHIGAFIAALAQGETPVQAARLANVAAALSTTQEGQSTAPTRATVLAALARQDADQSTQLRRRP